MVLMFVHSVDYVHVLQVGGVNRCGHTSLMFKLNLWLKWVYEKRVEIVQLNTTSFGTNSLIFAHNLLLLNSLVLKQIRSNLRLCLSNRSSSIYHCFKWTFVNDLYNYSFLFFSVQSVVEFSYYSYIHSHQTSRKLNGVSNC